jgi:hypothetical protein
MEHYDLLKQAISKSLELWTITSMFDLSLVLLFIGLILHFAGGYYRESLKNYKIRVSKENWSILFFLIRDFSLFASFGISILLINPDMFDDVKMPLPFFPIGVIFLGIALIYKIKGGLTENPKALKMFNLFLILAAVVQYIGFVFVMETVPVDWVKEGIAGNFWLKLNILKSNLNPELSKWTFYLTFPILVVILVMLIKVGVSVKLVSQEEPQKESAKNKN